jgi:DNA-directed RNA polymerase specialized sigma24 family protein
MAPQGSVTRWINLLKAGESQAVRPLFDRYFQQLVRLARRKLQGTPRGAADEEDVALSAFQSFCAGVERGAFPRLFDRDDLRHLLVLITARKACAVIQREGRQKRGGGRVFSARTGNGEDRVLAGFLSREPPPEFSVQVAEQWQRLLERLPSAELRAVAQGKLEGYTNEQLASRLGCVARTIERRLRLIRNVWNEEAQV